MASISPEFPPGPHPESSGKQRIISPRPIDLRKSESGVVLPAVFRRRSGSVVKAMLRPQVPLWVDQDSVSLVVVLNLQAEITASGISNRCANMNREYNCCSVSMLRRTFSYEL
jgi:hypothetical protein